MELLITPGFFSYKISEFDKNTITNELIPRFQ